MATTLDFTAQVWKIDGGEPRQVEIRLRNSRGSTSIRGEIDGSEYRSSQVYATEADAWRAIIDSAEKGIEYEIGRIKELSGSVSEHVETLASHNARIDRAAKRLADLTAMGAGPLPLPEPEEAEAADDA